MKRNDYKMVLPALSMARRKAKKLKYTKMEMRANLKWTGASESSDPFSDSVYIDVAQILSVQNRKLVRQGQMFRIKNFRCYTNDITPIKQMMKVGRINMSWPTFNAYRKGRALWHKHNALATENLSSAVYPKYHDFKVFMNHSHYENVKVSGGDANLLPVDFEDNAFPTGEWTYSTFHDSASTSDEYYAHMCGAHGGSSSNWTSVGLIQAYAESRPFPQVNATGTDDVVNATAMVGPWGKLFNNDDQSVDTYDDLVTGNEAPPYSRVQYPGGSEAGEGQSVFYGRLPSINQPSGTTGRVPTFDAPLGLIRLEIDAEESMTNSAVHVEFDVEILGEM